MHSRTIVRSFAPIARARYRLQLLAAGETVVRGGCYFYNREMIRVYFREVINPDDRTQMIGVRICATPR